MILRKYRWSRDYEAAEEELVTMFTRKKLKSERHIIEGGESFDPHSHDHDKQLWCAEGSIVLQANGQAFSLQAGDVLDLPANVIHEATSGFSGCVLYET